MGVRAALRLSPPITARRVCIAEERLLPTESEPSLTVAPRAADVERLLAEWREVRTWQNFSAIRGCGDGLAEALRALGAAREEERPSGSQGCGVPFLGPDASVTTSPASSAPFPLSPAEREELATWLDDTADAAEGEPNGDAWNLRKAARALRATPSRDALARAMAEVRWEAVNTALWTMLTKSERDVAVHNFLPEADRVLAALARGGRAT